jgi:hypothetical protein
MFRLIFVVWALARQELFAKPAQNSAAATFFNRGSDEMRNSGGELRLSNARRLYRFEIEACNHAKSIAKFRRILTGATPRFCIRLHEGARYNAAQVKWLIFFSFLSELL